MKCHSNNSGTLMYATHPERLTAGTWEYTQLKSKLIFQTIIFRFYVNLPGCMFFVLRCAWKPGGSSLAPYFEGILDTSSSLALFQAPASVCFILIELGTFEEKGNTSRYGSCPKFMKTLKDFVETTTIHFWISWPKNIGRDKHDKPIYLQENH